RLRASWFQAAEGARVFIELTDSMFGASCVQYPAADGQVRCLPERGDPKYADPGCTEPAASLFVGSGAAPPVVSIPKGEGSHVCRPGEPIGLAYFLMGSSTCWPDFSGIAPGQAVVRLGDEVSSSDFVALAEHDEPLDGRIAMHTIEASDGARLVGGLR